MKVLLFGVVAAVSMLWSADLVAQNGSISGVVYNDNPNAGVAGQPDAADTVLPNTKVELVDAAGNVIDEVFADENGRYSFTGVTPGSYRLRFTYPGSGLIVESTLMTVAPGVNLNFDAPVVEETGIGNETTSPFFTAVGTDAAQTRSDEVSPFAPPFRP